MAPEPPSSAAAGLVASNTLVRRLRLSHWSWLCFLGAALLAMVSAGVALSGLPVIGTPRSVLLRETRDRVADQLSALFAEQAALERVIGAVPAEARPALLSELCRDNPRLWNILISDASGRITTQARPMDAASPLLADLIVPINAIAEHRSAPQMGHSTDITKAPLLLSVTSAIGGDEPAVVTVLTRVRDLPSAGASLGRSWLLTDDSVVLADRPVEPALAIALQSALGAANVGDRTVLAPQADGTHRFMLRRLGGWPASLVMNAGLVPGARGLSNDILASALGLSTVLMLLLGVSMRVRAAHIAVSPLHSPVIDSAFARHEPAAAQRLASGLAHEINNLLAMLSLDAELIGTLRASDLEVAALSRSMLGAAGQGAALTQSLLAFAQRQVLQPRVVDLAALLRKHEAMLQARLQPDQILTFTGCEQECLVNVDGRALLAGLAELVRNAGEASDPRGEIRIDIVRRLEAGRLMACLVVDDAGPGMDAATLARAMEPGFSTKPEGRHLGMGLAACLGFARQSGGIIRLESEPGLGTRASLLMPAQSAVAGVTAQSAAVQRSSGDLIDRQRIISVLLVDDSEAVRSSIARYLRLEGYHVQEAGTVAQAVSMLARGVDIIVTDVVLEDGEDGWALADKARAIEPLLPLVFMSGFMTARQPDLLAGDDLASFVRKPVGGAELVAVIAGLLALRETRRPGRVVQA